MGYLSVYLFIYLNLGNNLELGPNVLYSRNGHFWESLASKVMICF